jgi:foldase protein PrsA
VPGVSGGRGAARIVGCAVLVGAALGAASLGGCGKSSSDRVVVEVGSSAQITASMVSHWLPIVAIRDYDLSPQGAVPAWVIPDPPRFTTCIGHLESAATDPAKPQPPVTRDALLRQCRSRNQALRQQTLAFLITGEALIADAKTRGLASTDREARQRLARVNATEFPSRTALQKYLKATGETEADQLLRARIKLASTKIEAQLEDAKGQSTQQRNRALLLFTEGFAKKWAAKTTCQPGYVIPNCREYKGSLAPQIVI